MLVVRVCNATRIHGPTVSLKNYVPRGKLSNNAIAIYYRKRKSIWTIHVMCMALLSRVNF